VNQRPMNRRSNGKEAGSTLLTGKAYVRSSDTNIRKTFARIRKEQRDVEARMRGEDGAAVDPDEAQGIHSSSRNQARPDSGSHVERRHAATLELIKGQK
jgi:hypothetical protein